ncbi:MAG: hypothetical protein AAF533_03020 [Acidobacteriota bacterium]
MPVEKFRSIEEMKEHRPHYEPGSPRLMRVIRHVMELARRTAPRRYPPGVYKFRTIGDARVHQDEWDRMNFEAHQERIRQANEPAG